MRSFVLALVGATLLAGPTTARGKDVEDPANAEAQEVERTEQEMGEGGEEDLAKKAQNPLANIISMPLQWNTDFGIGSDEGKGHVLNIQPIYPVSLSKGATLINRMILPLPKSVPGGGGGVGTTAGLGAVVPGFATTMSDAGQALDRETGLGDITLMNWYSPEPKGSFMWGFGPVTIWPTATDDRLGDGKFSIGPSAVLVLSNPKFIAASVINAWWSVGGDSDAPDVGVFYWQPIFTYFLPNKWYVVTAPVIIKDLEGQSGQKWIVPLGGGVGKMFNVGTLPLDLTAQVYKYVEKPDGGPDWVLRLQLKFIFPK